MAERKKVLAASEWLELDRRSPEQVILEITDAAERLKNRVPGCALAVRYVNSEDDGLYKEVRMYAVRDETDAEMDDRVHQEREQAQRTIAVATAKLASLSTPA